ncbi:hypothetical protein BU25DRAFT_304199, partial [Macroventuria anomochaeta]
LARIHISIVKKEAFIPAFQQAYNCTITKANILSSFRATGLVPYNPDAVLSKLDVQLRT